jgi:cytochrome P450
LISGDRFARFEAARRAFRNAGAPVLGDGPLGGRGRTMNTRSTQVTNISSGDVAESACPVVHWEFGAGPLPVPEAFERFKEMGHDRRIMRVEEAQGYFLVTDQKLATEVLQHPDRFSNVSVIPLEPDPPYSWIPLMLDPPEHTGWRRLLAPHFTPRRAAAMADSVRLRCAAIIDEFVSKGSVDFVEDFARRFPTAVFMDMFGLPMADLEQFLEWEFLIMHPDNEADPERTKFLAAMNEVTAYFAQLIERRRVTPETDGTDLLSVALGWEVDGEPITSADLLSLCLFMFIAGLDTVTSQLSYTFYHLATHVGDRQRVVAEPEVRQVAVEESLRMYTIISTARKVVEDTELGGCPIKAGQMISLPLAGANRDEHAFPNPDFFDLDRKVNRHLAFGAGPHRCLGAHLARVELKIALDEWHARIPEYQIEDGFQTVERTAGTWGIDSLPLVWTT